MKKVISFLIISLISCDSNRQKSFDKVDDFVGTAWYSPLENTSLYFQSKNIVVYHIFVGNIYSSSPSSLLRKSGSYVYNPNLNAIAIQQVGDLTELPLKYSEDSKNKYLLCESQNRGWQLLTEENLINLTK